MKKKLRKGQILEEKEKGKIKGNRSSLHNCKIGRKEAKIALRAYTVSMYPER